MEKSFLGTLWTKNEQSPQSHVAEGLQRYVLSLSTVGCTVDVGKCPGPLRVMHRVVRAGLVPSALQKDAPAAEVRQLLLQGVDLLFAQGQLQLYAVGGEVFLDQQPAQFGYP